MVLLNGQQIHLSLIDQVLHDFAPLQLLVIELLGGLLICRVFQIWSEQTQVLILLRLVFFLLHLEFVCLMLDTVQHIVSELELEVVEDAAWNFLANRDQALARHPQLSHAAYLELFDLTMHIVEESAEVLWDLVVANEVLGILARVEFGHEILACFVNLHNGIRELQVLL